MHCLYSSVLFFQIVKGVEWAPFSFHSRSVLRMVAEEGGNFTCQAMNQLSSQTAMDQSSFMVYVEKPDKDKDDQGSSQVTQIINNTQYTKHLKLRT